MPAKSRYGNNLASPGAHLYLAAFLRASSAFSVVQIVFVVRGNPSFFGGLWAWAFSFCTSSFLVFYCLPKCRHPKSLTLVVVFLCSSCGFHLRAPIFHAFSVFPDSNAFRLLRYVSALNLGAACVWVSVCVCGGRGIRKQCFPWCHVSVMQRLSILRRLVSFPSCCFHFARTLSRPNSSMSLSPLKKPPNYPTTQLPLAPPPFGPLGWHVLIMPLQILLHFPTVAAVRLLLRMFLETTVCLSYTIQNQKGEFFKPTFSYIWSTGYWHVHLLSVRKSVRFNAIKSLPLKTTIS